MDRKGCDGTYLRQCLEEANMTPADLARALKVSPQTVSNWTSGLRDVPVTELRKIVELGYLWNPVLLSSHGMEWAKLFNDFGKLEEAHGRQTMD